MTDLTKIDRPFGLLDEETPRDEKPLICRGGGLIGDEVCQYDVWVGAWICPNYVLEDSDFESLGYTSPACFIPLSALGEPDAL